MRPKQESRQIGVEGLGLFERVRREAEDWDRTHARTTDPSTSHEAAASMRSVAHTQRLYILEYLGKCGERGATADELDTALGWRVGRAGRRLGELLKAGLVRVAPTTRETATGRQAQVYALPVYARG